MSAGSPPTKQYFTDSYVFNWNNQTFRADLILILPVAICLAVGLCIGRPGVGMIAAGGVMTAGFGAKQSIDDSRLLPMVFVSLGMAFAAFLGVVVGHTNLLLVPIAALWGFGYGCLPEERLDTVGSDNNASSPFWLHPLFPPPLRMLWTALCLSSREERFRFCPQPFYFAPLTS